jgi:hypothetical protein
MKFMYSACTDCIKAELGRRGWLSTGAGLKDACVLRLFFVNAVMVKVVIKLDLNLGKGNCLADMRDTK